MFTCSASTNYVGCRFLTFSFLFFLFILVGRFFRTGGSSSPTRKKVVG